MTEQAHDSTPEAAQPAPIKPMPDPNRLDAAANKIMDDLRAMGATRDEALFLFSHLAATLLSPHEKMYKYKWLKMFNEHYQFQKGFHHKQALKK